jgi:hypothetical protein
MERTMNDEIVAIETSQNELGGYDIRVRTKKHSIYFIGRFYDLRSFPNPLELMGTTVSFAIEWMVRELNKTRW